MKRVILASQSPRRKEILGSVGLKFETINSEYAEDNTLDLPPRQLVEHHAVGKARWVAERHPDALVIAADTLVFLGAQVLGKPKDTTELITMIRSLSGRSHTVCSGFTIIGSGRELTSSDEAQVYFRELTENEIQAYANTGDGLDKAGGYGIQGPAKVFVERIDGDYLSIVGLSLCKLTLALREFNIELLK